MKGDESGAETKQPEAAWLDSHGRTFGHFIDGKWLKPGGRESHASRNPATGEHLAATTQGTSEDLDAAVEAAAKAFESWSRLPGHVRARHLYNAEQLSMEGSIPAIHSQFPAFGDTPLGLHPPGNTVVINPAGPTRLSALLLAEACTQAGLPAGVLNVVTGDGALGEALAIHPGIKQVAFAGDAEVARALRRATAGTGTKLTLQLGGKSPFVVFESADLDSAVEGVVDATGWGGGGVGQWNPGLFLSRGAGAQLLIQESVVGDFTHRLKRRMGQLRVGDALDKAVDLGALADEAQRGLLEGYVEEARAEGAEIFQAWAAFPSGNPYYPPTLITGVETSSRCVREEISGPVLVVLTFRTPKEAVTLANNTPYGLAASVWTETLPLALEVAHILQVGTVWVNGHNMFDAASAFGGYKEIGYGRDGGKEGLYDYVRPVWETPPRPSVGEMNYKSFGVSYGANVPPIPGKDGIPLSVMSALGKNVPSVDRTYKLYYGGAQKRPDAMCSRPVLDHAGKIMAYVADGNAKDIRNAVEAAHKAAPGWARRAAHARAQIVYYLAENLELRRVEVASRLAALTGASSEDALHEVDLSVQRLFHWAAYSDKYGGAVQETPLYGAALLCREPVGVVGVVCPDDSPLLSFVSLLAPAIARGNAVVMVASECSPLPALDFYQVLDTSDVPGGVVNIITGGREHLSRVLAEHQDVQAVWYFGTQEGSKFIEWASAGNLKQTWVNYGAERHWADPTQGSGEEFLHHATQCKSIWLPMGETFAN
uniref:Aldehyde dehydrogenase domain-containing protein n=1 Tax=Sphenodon punctatus TaxID=8508 RepID=A0A8D0GG21_SPHPU